MGRPKMAATFSVEPLERGTRRLGPFRVCLLSSPTAISIMLNRLERTAMANLAAALRGPGRLSKTRSWLTSTPSQVQTTVREVDVSGVPVWHGGHKAGAAEELMEIVTSAGLRPLPARAQIATHSDLAVVYQEEDHRPQEAEAHIRTAMRMDRQR
jgi:hypothetical protein